MMEVKRNWFAELDAEIQERQDNGGMSRAAILRDMMEDSDDPAMIAYEHRQALRAIGIETGVYVEISKADLDAMVILGHGKKYDFKASGKYYVFGSWEGLEKGE